MIPFYIAYYVNSVSVTNTVLRRHHESNSLAKKLEDVMSQTDSSSKNEEAPPTHNNWSWKWKLGEDQEGRKRQLLLLLVPRRKQSKFAERKIAKGPLARDLSRARGGIRVALPHCRRRRRQRAQRSPHHYHHQVSSSLTWYDIMCNNI